MKAPLQLLTLGLALTAGAAHAQLPAVISAPVAEGISRKQITHQTITGVQMVLGKKLAGDMTAVSGQIKGIIDQTQQLHDTWYSSLLQISSGVRNYRRVREIYDAQAGMIQQYASMNAYLAKRGLTSAQVGEAGKTYNALLAENIGLISDLVAVLSANRAKMTDPERLEFINNIADRMGSQQELFTYFTRKCEALGQQQQQQAVDAKSLLVLTGGK